MSHLKSFDLFSPVLSTDVINPPETVNNEIPVPEPAKKKKKKKNRKRKNPNPNQKEKQTQKKKEPIIKIQETQEEIDAWINERRKRFPTRERIAQKEQSEREREEKGALDLSVEANKLRRRQKKQKGNKPIEASTYKPTKIPSILDKIVEDEQRKEYSIILQCFRYFVKHNFLQDEYNPNQINDPSQEYSYYSDSSYSYSEEESAGDQP